MAGVLPHTLSDYSDCEEQGWLPDYRKKFAGGEPFPHMLSRPAIFFCVRFQKAMSFKREEGTRCLPTLIGPLHFRICCL